MAAPRPWVHVRGHLRSFEPSADSFHLPGGLACEYVSWCGGVGGDARAATVAGVTCLCGQAALALSIA